ncbi:MAG TPA: ATP-binding protein [Eoetvoesiella sp.]|jgi:two-component system osmolarity sensor histidine kinase EnvZ|uniref:sensor histidine kinase n=1 Tax=Eoetvoesiella sp. TaxID=1966355 RepID=UPI002C1AE57E|nr:ATP-binding protein [Eoetvoesiella sp.]HWK61179.1 ATP-binding protein [Eoetvoesiella sp.]
MSLLPQHFSRITARLKLGLFSRSFLLLAALMLVSLGAWLQVFFSMEEGPRAIQMAQRVTTSVSITRSALIYAPPSVRPALMLDLATKESLRVQPREPTDTLEPLPNSNYWNHVAAEIKKRQGANTQVMWAVNRTPGIWVSFDINRDHYWLVFDREQLGLTAGIEWFSWGATALLLALIGSAISVRFVNRPLAQLAKVAQQLARGETPSPLPEKGPLEIRDMNIAFNRMARDLRQTEADREIMLAGISHDLRTPLARMRLEIEMSSISDEARQAIDDDLGQINHSIGQLMEYARPAGVVPDQGINVSRVLHDLFERERSHTESLGGHLTAALAPNLYARITAHDLKRVVSNLIENARRYGCSPADDSVYINLSARLEGNIVAIEVTDQGAGIAESDIERLLRPFSRGESARTGVSGAGLGLAIVERLLGQVGGQLKLLSRPSGGLIARIELPRSKG